MNGQAQGSISTLLAIIVALPTIDQTSKQVAEARLIWRIPVRSFVEFTPMVSKILPKEAVWTIHGNPASATGFYAHELKNGKTLDFDHSTLQDVVVEVALSLSGARPRRGRKHKLTQNFDACHNFGRVRARGTVTTKNVRNPRKVQQTGQFKLSKVNPIPFSDERQLSSAERNGSHNLEGGVMTFDRVVDAIAGRVLSFTAKLSGSISDSREKKPNSQDLTIEICWEFKEIRQAGTASFGRRVRAAIDLGQKYLAEHTKEWLTKGKFFHSAPDSLRRHVGTGYLALTLLTLCKGNPKRNSKAIQTCLAELRRRTDHEDTYSLATAIMAIESYYEPANEAQQIRDGLLTAPTERKLSSPDRKLVAAWTKRLLGNRSGSISSYRWRFRYTTGKDFDNSCTQFAALGLAAAVRCGMKMPAKLWTGLAAHYLGEQSSNEGHAFPLLLETYSQLRTQRKAKKRRGSTQAAGRKHKAVSRGFGYQNRMEPYGSMTCAGLVGLAIVRAKLAGSRSASATTKGAVDVAIRNSFAWIHRNYDMRNNPRHERYWYYYYLYTLERACELAGIARINGHDWYFDGAMQLLGLQNKDGSWPDDGTHFGLEDTCFSILFLKKAVAPAITGKR